MSNSLFPTLFPHFPLVQKPIFLAFQKARSCISTSIWISFIQCCISSRSEKKKGPTSSKRNRLWALEEKQKVWGNAFRKSAHSFPSISFWKIDRCSDFSPNSKRMKNDLWEMDLKVWRCWSLYTYCGTLLQGKCSFPDKKECPDSPFINRIDSSALEMLWDPRIGLKKGKMFSIHPWTMYIPQTRRGKYCTNKGSSVILF